MVESMKESIRVYVTRLIKQYGLKPSRKLGQHFLVDERAVERFVNAVDQCGVVYEIGCGLGSLTIPLAHRASYLFCSELDETLAGILKNEVESRGIANVDIIKADATRFEISKRAHIVVSNTPFNISSRLVVKLCRDEGLLYAVLGVQNEVGLRLLAKPGESSYGRLSVIAQLCFDIVKLFKIPPRAFIPRPEVATLVLRLTPKHSLAEKEIADVELLTRRLFSLRKRKVPGALKEAFNLSDEEIRKLLSRCGVSQDLRVYELTPSQLLRITREGFLELHSL